MSYLPPHLWHLIGKSEKEIEEYFENNPYALEKPDNSVPARFLRGEASYEEFDAFNAGQNEYLKWKNKQVKEGAKNAFTKKT
jgi:hypothetical protein